MVHGCRVGLWGCRVIGDVVADVISLGSGVRV